MSEMIDDDQDAKDFGSRGGNKGGKLGKVIITLMVIIIIVIGGWYLLDRYTNISLPSFGGQTSDDWQAVFLSNGQVYFGKIKAASKKQVVLADIYYLQVVEVPLQTTQTGPGSDAQPKTQQELKLIKLGNELHGPADEMIINPDHVLLTEKLKNDSRVVQAINNYLADQKKAAAPKQ
ncbi:hypothetical protein HZA71_00520 [Candidatus Falkowbacteria bacterium]|nr:hypothetical protein [Candidatus Falkowbacteria bacterium]